MKNKTELIFCECGCGLLRPLKDEWYRVKRFLKGHQAKATHFDCKGSNNPNWKGGFKINCNGYKTIKANDHPNCDANGYVLEHRLVMEEHLGRFLTPEEVVHHINGNKLDNDISNLKLFPSISAHRLHHCN